MIVASIDLAKIDKTKLYTHANGKKFLNLVIWENDQPDKYGNTHAIQQSISAEERKAGVKAPYIGNGKQMTRGGSAKPPAAKPASAPQRTIPAENLDEDVPF
jgi:hypothetical protein